MESIATIIKAGTQSRGVANKGPCGCKVAKLLEGMDMRIKTQDAGREPRVAKGNLSQ